jgi:T5orf172 domain-containing protein
MNDSAMFFKIYGPKPEKKTLAKRRRGDAIPVAGCVYVLGNRAMPGLYKIGLTSGRPEDRAAQLSSHSAVPTEFVTLFYALVDDAMRTECLLHTLWEDHRVNEKREFFKLSRSMLRTLRDSFNRLPGRRECVEGMDYEEFVRELRG